MSKQGYVATAGGFCVAISSRSVAEKTDIKESAATTTNTAMESASTPSQPADLCTIKKSA